MCPKHLIFAVEASKYCKLFGLDFLPLLSTLYFQKKKKKHIMEQ